MQGNFYTYDYHPIVPCFNCNEPIDVDTGALVGESVQLLTEEQIQQQVDEKIGIVECKYCGAHIELAVVLLS